MARGPLLDQETLHVSVFGPAGWVGNQRLSGRASGGGGKAALCPHRTSGQLCPDSSRWSRSSCLRIETSAWEALKCPPCHFPAGPPWSSPALYVLPSCFSPRVRVVVFRPAGPWGARGHRATREKGERSPKGPFWTFAHGGGEQRGFIYGGATLDFSWCFLLLFLYGLRLFVSFNSCLVTF